MQDSSSAIEKITERKKALKSQCISCCCSFYISGKGIERKFWSQVLSHYERVKQNAGNQIKDSILFILDDTNINASAFTGESKALIKAIAGRDVGKVQNIQERTPLLDERGSKNYWSEKKL